MKGLELSDRLPGGFAGFSTELRRLHVMEEQMT